MSVGNINSASNESLGAKAKGIARHALSLVNQALLDGIQQLSDFSDILGTQVPKSSSPKHEVRPVQEQPLEGPSLEVVSNSEFEEPQNHRVVSNEQQEVVPSEEDRLLEEALLEETAQTETVVLAESAVIPDGSESQVSDNIAQTEMLAAQILTVAPELKEVKVPLANTVSSAQEAVQEDSEQAAALSAEELAMQANNSQDTEIPAEIEQQIKDLKQSAPKKNDFLRAQAQLAENAQVPEHVEFKPFTEAPTAQAQEALKAAQIAHERMAAELGIKQSAAKSILHETILSNAFLMERLATNVNDHLVPTKAANSGLKLGADFSIVSASKTGTASQQSAQSLLALASQNSAEQGQKSDAAKATKPLTRGQTLATLEKVEAVLKKISESKDGSTISLRLDPPSLGTVKADVSLRDGVLHARLTAENPQVLQLLRERASDLQLILRKMGLEVEKVSVSVNSGDNGTFAGDAENQKGNKGTRQGSFFSAEANFADLAESQVIDHWIA
jgi:flagellar hook-length control protein FliK